MIPELMDTKQVMAAIGVKSLKKLRKMIESKEIPPPISLSTKPRRWRKDTIEKLLSEPEWHAR